MTAPLTDKVAMPVAVALLSCFRTQLNKLVADRIPAQIGLRAGAQVSVLVADDGYNECCPGLAWVRIAGGPFPSWTNFPSQESTPQQCPPFAYGVSLELGVVRCAPSGDNFGIPSQDEWDQFAMDLANDDQAMRSAIRCCFPMTPTPELPYPPRIQIMGTYEPLPIEGGCAGGTRTVTVQVIPGCEDC